MKQTNDESEELTYLQKISNVFGIPIEYIQKFRDTGCMDEIAVRNALIRSEYNQLQKEGVTVKKRMEKLRERYNLEMRQLQNIVYANIKHMYYCKYCGLQIPYYRVQNNDGVCAQCIINRIKF